MDDFVHSFFGEPRRAVQNVDGALRWMDAARDRLYMDRSMDR